MHPKMTFIMIHWESLGFNLLYFAYKIITVRLLALEVKDILRHYE